MKLTPQILAFYLGCDVQTPDGIGKLVGLPWSIADNDRASVHFGKLVKTPNAVDEVCKTSRNYGVYLLSEQHYEAIATTDPDFTRYSLPGGVKPILRRLSDMTEEEQNEVWHMEEPKAILEMVIPGGTKSRKVVICPERMSYLLSKRFDLFGLIEAGEAIDQSKI